MRVIDWLLDSDPAHPLAGAARSHGCHTLHTGAVAGSGGELFTRRERDGNASDLRAFLFGRESMTTHTPAVRSLRLGR